MPQRHLKTAWLTCLQLLRALHMFGLKTPKPKAAEAPGGRQDKAGAGDGNGKQNKSTGTKLKLAQRVLEQCLKAAPA